jgi:ankyrin repeat protein
MFSSGSASDNALYTRVLAICQSPETPETAAKLTALLDECPSPMTRAALLSEEDDDRFTPLMRACNAGNLAAARVLCAARAIVEQGRRQSGNQALMFASERGHLEVVRFLVLECNATVSQSAFKGRTALSEASYGGHADVVRFLVAEGTASEDTCYGSTALGWAASKGHFEVVRTLLPAGADVAPCLSPYFTWRNAGAVAAVAAAAYDAAGAAATLIAKLQHPRPPSLAAAVLADTAVRAQEAWLMDALARALRGKC